MATSSKAKSALPYLQNLLEDEYVQEQLRDSVRALRDVYGRAAREREQAADDKRLYQDLRRAATSIRDLTKAFRKPEPPPKRRGRNLLIIALAATGAAMLTRLGRDRQADPASPDIHAAPAAAAPEAAGDAFRPETVTVS